MALSFRSATSDDVDDVVDLVDSAYRGDRSRAGWTTEADLLGGQRTDRVEVEGLVAAPASTLVLALDSTGLVGCVLVLLENAADAHVGMFAVRPKLQSRGVGTALLAHAEDMARARGATRAKMTVIEQRSELLEWYERRGYQRTGKTEPFPYGNPRFGLPKRDDLWFVVLEKSLLLSPR